MLANIIPNNVAFLVMSLNPSHIPDEIPGQDPSAETSVFVEDDNLLFGEFLYLIRQRLPEDAPYPGAIGFSILSLPETGTPLVELELELGVGLIDDCEAHELGLEVEDDKEGVFFVRTKTITYTSEEDEGLTQCGFKEELFSIYPYHTIARYLCVTNVSIEDGVQAHIFEDEESYEEGAHERANLSLAEEDTFENIVEEIGMGEAAGLHPTTIDQVMELSPFVAQAHILRENPPVLS